MLPYTLALYTGLFSSNKSHTVQRNAIFPIRVPVPRDRRIDVGKLTLYLLLLQIAQIVLFYFRFEQSM